MKYSDRKGGRKRRAVASLSVLLGVTIATPAAAHVDTQGYTVSSCYFEITNYTSGGYTFVSGYSNDTDSFGVRVANAYLWNGNWYQTSYATDTALPRPFNTSRSILGDAHSYYSATKGRGGCRYSSGSWSVEQTNDYHP